jgi:hypothetical protein
MHIVLNGVPNLYLMIWDHYGECTSPFCPCIHKPTTLLSFAGAMALILVERLGWEVGSRWQVLDRVSESTVML